MNKYIIFSRSYWFLAVVALIRMSPSWAAINTEDIKEIRSFIADVMNPAPIIGGSTEQPQRIAFKKHVKGLKLLISDPGILETSLGLAPMNASRFLLELKANFQKLGLFDLKGELIKSGNPDQIILGFIDHVSDELFNDLDFVIEAFVGAYKFPPIIVNKLSQIKVGESTGKIGDFIIEVLKTYFDKQATLDKRFIFATFLRDSMPNDPDEKKLLAIAKAAGPFFHKILQLVGDFVDDSTPDGKKLKDVLNEIKRNLLPINNYDLQQLIKEVEKAANNRFKITIDKTLGVASVGHASLVTLTDNSGKKERVVLKFIKPGVKERAERDIDILNPIASRLGVLSFFQGTIDDILAELDFTNELKNLKAAVEVYNTNDPNDRVFAVTPVPNFPEGAKWLAMTLAPGKSFADFNKDTANNDEERLDREIEYLVRGIGLEELTNKWMLQAFFGKREGLYHGDLHAGNILIDIKTDQIKQFLRSKYPGLKYNDLTRERMGEIPKELYRVTLIDFGNVGYLTANQRLNVLNFFISTLNQIHSWDGFFESYENLVGGGLESSKKAALKEAVKSIFEKNPDQGSLLGKLVSFFLMGTYPPLPPVMANFGRSQAMLNNIFGGLDKQATALNLAKSKFNFTKAILEDLKSLLAKGTFLVFDRVDVTGNQLYLNTGNLLAVAEYGVNYGVDWIKEKLKLSKVQLNGECDTTAQCQNWTAWGQAGIACCEGRCLEKKKDFAGVSYCPHECVGSFAGKRGTCK